MSFEIGFHPTLKEIVTAMSRKGYRIFNTPSEPFNLNIVGIRGRTTVPNRFDDWITVFYRSRDQWMFNTFPATTDPGLYFLGDELGSDEGTAILKEGQYRGAYKLGKHKNLYKALVQAKPVTVLRDVDRDQELDLGAVREETGHFGINIHRARRDRASIQVDNWSAGCQVMCDPLQFNYFLDVCEKGAKHWGNAFTYTLLHQDDLEEA